MNRNDRPVNKLENGIQLCFSCKKACGGCEWSQSLTPVPR